MNTLSKTICIISAVLFSLASTTLCAADNFNFLTRVTGDSIGDGFYYIANGSGDVNGDGYGDVLIGAPEGTDTTYVRLYFGGADFDTIPDLIFYGGPAYALEPGFGAGCAIIGDVNDDGFDDILIGNLNYQYIYPPGAGIAYLYFGGVDIDTIPDIIFEGEYWHHNLGYHVSGAGDVNGDGYDDWLINAPNDDIAGFGRIYLFFGGENPDRICDVFFIGEPFDFLQFNNPQLGDINDDGYDDMIFYTLNYVNYVCEIHLGSENMDNVPDIVYENSCNGGGIGDVNDDGYNDWMLSRYGLELFFGSADLDTASDMIFWPEPPCFMFRYEFAGEDIDGDTVGDIIISGYESGGSFRGLIIGYSGGEYLDSLYDYIFDSCIPEELLGTTIGLADVNGDSVFEVLGGASQSIQPNSAWGPGRVWFLATPEVRVAPDFKTLPQEFSLHQNYPNPFNPTTTIPFALPTESRVKIAIYNILGQRVAVLEDGILQAGNHIASWNSTGMASGVYLIVLESPVDFRQTRKITLLK